MARKQSALKAQRASLRKRARNAQKLAALDRLVRMFKREETANAESFVLVQKAVDKAAKTKLMHPNKAARMKSRLARAAGKPAKTVRTVAASKRKAKAKAKAKANAKSKK